jgi:1,2-phenylacetyl-CoA epoxidase PaaB subunit
MAAKRDIKKNASGGWDVLREGDRRAAVHADTKERALARARDVVRREGGGEVRLINEAGKIVRSSRVEARPQSRVQRRRAA